MKLASTLTYRFLGAKISFFRKIKFFGWSDQLIDWLTDQLLIVNGLGRGMRNFSKHRNGISRF